MVKKNNFIDVAASSDEDKNILLDKKSADTNTTAPDEGQDDEQNSLEIQAGNQLSMEKTDLDHTDLKNQHISANQKKKHILSGQFVPKINNYPKDSDVTHKNNLQLDNLNEDSIIKKSKFLERKNISIINNNTVRENYNRENSVKNNTGRENSVKLERLQRSKTRVLRRRSNLNKKDLPEVYRDKIRSRNSNHVEIQNKDERSLYNKLSIINKSSEGKLANLSLPVSQIKFKSKEEEISYLRGQIDLLRELNYNLFALLEKKIR